MKFTLANKGQTFNKYEVTLETSDWLGVIRVGYVFIFDRPNANSRGSFSPELGEGFHTISASVLRDIVNFIDSTPFQR